MTSYNNKTFKGIIDHTTGKTAGYYISTDGDVLKITVAEDGSMDILECAQCTNNSGYAYFNADGERLFVAPTLWEAFNGPIPEGMTLDHKDRNKLNNSLGNMRLLTPTQQAYNKEVPKFPKSLYQDKQGKWYWNMYACGQKMKAPHYETPEDALKGYLEYREIKLQKYAEQLKDADI